MAKYTGKSAIVPGSPESIAERFADLTQMQAAAEGMTPEQRAKAGNVVFTTNSMTITNPAVGAVEFKVLEHSPKRVVLGCSTPMKMDLVLDLKPHGEDESEVTTSIDVDIPMMLRPLIGPQLQKAADEMGSMMTNLFNR